MSVGLAALREWGDWRPAAGQILAILCAIMSVGVLASLALEHSLGLEQNQMVAAFALGAAPMVLCAFGLIIRGARDVLPLRVLLLVFTYLGLLILAWLPVVMHQALDASELSTIPHGGLALAGMAVVAVTGVIYLRDVRLGIARFLPVDPSDFAHVYVLSSGLGVLCLSLFTLIPTGEPLLFQIPEEMIEAEPPAVRNMTMAATAIWSIPAAFLLIGLGRRHDLQGAMTRLGLQWQDKRHLLYPIPLAVGLVAAGVGLGLTLEYLWNLIGAPSTDGERFADLAGLPWHPLGMLLLGISAGVSEELIVRGVMQPRLGLLFSNLLFTSAHAFQYATDGLVVVFLIGLAFGLIRSRFGLVPAIATHALYNFLLLLLSTFTDFG